MEGEGGGYMKRLRWLILALLLALPGCSALDVVGNDAVRAFGDRLASFPAEALETGGWSLASPDRTAWLEWDGHGFRMAVDAEPFLSASLDAETSLFQAGTARRLVYGTPALAIPAPAEDPLEQFRILAKPLRDSIGYHMETDRYHIVFENGAMFEWAKDSGGNAPKLVFMLDPEPFLKAGVQPDAVEGWTYAQITLHMGGRPKQLWKFVKPVD